VYVIPPFALMQKLEPKNPGKPKWLRLFCRPRTATVILAFIIHLLCSKQYESLLHATFSKGHVFPSGVTNSTGAVSRFSFLKL
jgi:hypothetical protein